MNRNADPEISVIIITPDRYETIRRTIFHLRRQVYRESLEVIIVAPALNELKINTQELEGFWGFRLVEVGDMRSTAQARSAGIRQSKARVVAFLEDHSCPGTDWAEALIKAHKGEWAAVGPAMVNANPDSALSWANLLIEYGQWLDPVQAGSINHIPGHNGSYKRSILLEYGRDLDAMLEAETVLHWDMLSKGHKVCMEPRAKVSHWNFSLLSSTFSLRFYSGRLFAASRSLHWGRFKRLFYTCASPLIPIVRMARIIKELCKTGRPHYLLPRIFFLLMAGLALEALGEMCGYASGFGNAKQQLKELEFHRIRHLNKKDRQLYESF